jgi:hypothetical protein
LFEALGGLIGTYLLWPLGLMQLLGKLAGEEGTNKVAGVLAMVLGVPFVLFCVGMVELVTGRPFRQLSSSWNQMNEWKQGLMSFLLLCLGIGLVGLLLYLAARYFTWAG